MTDDEKDRQLRAQLIAQARQSAVTAIIVSTCAIVISLLGLLIGYLQ